MSEDGRAGWRRQAVTPVSWLGQWKPWRPRGERDLGQSRVYRAGLTGVVTLGVRGVTWVIGLVSIPILAQYLGTERLGMWLVLSLLLSWGGVADFGLTLSLTNAVSRAEGLRDRDAAARAVSNVVFPLAGLAVITCLIFVLGQSLIPWERVFNVRDAQATAEAGSLATVGMIYFALRLMSVFPAPLFAAHQEGYIYLVWSAVGTLVGFVALLAGISFHVSLAALAALYYGSALLADLAAGVHLLGWRRPYLRPRWHLVQRHIAWSMLRQGLAFWVATVSAILFLQTDLLLVSQLFGAASAATYGTALRLTTLIGSVQAAFVHPLWPSYSEAFARRDTGWIRRIFARSIIGSLIVVVPLAAVGLVAGRTTVQLMTRSSEPVDSLIIVALVLTEVINAVARCISTLLNGLGHLKSQVVFVPIGIVVNLALSLILSRLVGPAGVGIATGICLLIFWVGIMGTDAVRTLNRMVEPA